MFIEFSPIHGLYKDLVILSKLNDTLKHYNQPLNIEDIQLCTNFGIDIVNSVRTDVIESIDNLISQWLEHHPNLQDFYVWDHVKGLGLMLKQGTLSLLMTLLLNDSPRTVIYLQSHYFPHLDTYDGNPSTLIDNYRRYIPRPPILIIRDGNVLPEESAAPSELGSGSVQEFITMVRRTGSYVPEILERICQSGDIEPYKKILENANTNIQSSYFIRMRNWQARHPFINHCRFRRLRAIKLLLEQFEQPHFTSKPDERQQMIDFLLEDVKSAGDDDYGVEVVTHLEIIDRLPLDRIARYYKMSGLIRQGKTRSICGVNF